MKRLTLIDAKSGSIPIMGYGCGTAWFNSGEKEREKQLIASVNAALDSGFNHVDEAEVYANEVYTGQALKLWFEKSGKPRSSLFITSKVGANSVDKGIEGVCRTTLKALGVDYLDLYLIHAPFKSNGDAWDTPIESIWKQMEALVEAGLVKAIGVSNWLVKDLERIYDNAKIKPACNQIEAHPYLQQDDLFAYCSERKIIVTAYAPLASLTRERDGPVDVPVNAIATAHGCTPAQVLLCWAMQRGYGVLTTSSKQDRMTEYLGALDIELTPDEIRSITEAGLKAQKRLFWSSAFAKTSSS